MEALVKDLIRSVEALTCRVESMERQRLPSSDRDHEIIRLKRLGRHDEARQLMRRKA